MSGWEIHWVGRDQSHRFHFGFWCQIFEMLGLATILAPHHL